MNVYLKKKKKKKKKKSSLQLASYTVLSLVMSEDDLWTARACEEASTPRLWQSFERGCPALTQLKPGTSSRLSQKAMRQLLAEKSG